MTLATAESGACPEQRVRDLLAELVRTADAAGDLDLCLSSFEWCAEEPRYLPACRQIEGATGVTPVIDALKNTVGFLRWQQTYGLQDGMSQGWLDDYGWAHLVSPDGPIVSASLRIAIAIWGAGYTYPAHAHGPKETYVILSGDAVFDSAGRPKRRVGPGDLVHHAPWQTHGFAVGDTPLIVGTIWQGEGLLQKSRLEGPDR